MQGNSFKQKLISLYGKERGKLTADKLQKIIDKAKPKIICKNRSLWDEKDITLITYADSFQESGTPTLKTLNKFLREYIEGMFSIVHILPFYPSTSDRGFCPSDFFRVNKEFGWWSDVKAIGRKYRLMTDLILNHVSLEHYWFKKFLESDPRYENFFIAFREDNLPSDEQIKMVRRGRTTPLLNPFNTKKGVRYLWSTYSTGGIIDRADLNYHNSEILLEMIRVYLFYLEKGMRILRFDGVGGLWKELGTTCKHLSQNHTIVSLFRGIMDKVSCGSLIFTETTTASFEENISYLNNKEAHVVYNFALAPHVLLAFYTESAEKLGVFIDRLKTDSGSNTFFNILDVHDGINMYAASRMLGKNDLQIIFDGVKNRCGEFSYRNLPDGGKEIKEMHITWWSALSKDGEEPFELQLRKFITSRAIAMSFAGIPAVYYLSLFGAKNDTKAYEATQHGRDINRTNLFYKEISEKLSDKNSREFNIFNALMNLVEKRRSLKAFHPNAKQEVLYLDPRVFAIVRGEGKSKVLALHNVSKQKVSLHYQNKNYTLDPYSYSWNIL